MPDTTRDQFVARLERTARAARAATVDPDALRIVGALNELAKQFDVAKDEAVVYLHMLGYSWTQLAKELGVDPKNMPRKYGAAFREAQRRAAGASDEEN